MPPLSQVSHIRHARRVIAASFACGALIVAVFQFSHSQSVGGYAGLLKIGSEYDTRELIESELPGVPILEGEGHDGQLFYVIGLDPWGQSTPESIAQAAVGYRYRRIGYPLASSLAGLLDGTALLAGMVVVAAGSAGLATAAAASIALHFERSPWLSLGVAMNPGVWLSGILLTADVLALALGLLGILGYVRRWRYLTVLALAGAALTKEVAICFAIGVAGHALWTRRRGLALFLIVGSALPLAVWLAYVNTTIGDAFSTVGQSTWPFLGLLDAASIWHAQATHEITLTVLMVAFMVLGSIGLLRVDALWRWLTWPWIALGLLLSHWVWDLGSNTVRTLAPIVALTVLGLGTGREAQIQVGTTRASP